MTCISAAACCSRCLLTCTPPMTYSHAQAFRYLLAKKVERVSMRLRAEKKKAAREHAQAKSRARKQNKKKKGGSSSSSGAGSGGGVGGGGGGGEGAAALAAAELEAAERAAWNSMTPELLDCSKAHCYYVISDNFVNAVEKAAMSIEADERKLFPALDMLCRLFVLSSLSNWLDWFLAMGYMDRKQMFLVKEGVDALCEESREIAVPAVDAFGLSDLILRSPLGKREIKDPAPPPRSCSRLLMGCFVHLRQKRGVGQPASVLLMQLPACCSLFLLTRTLLMMRLHSTGRRDGDVYNAYFDRVLQKPGVEDRAVDYESQISPMLKANL